MHVTLVYDDYLWHAEVYAGGRLLHTTAGHRRAVDAEREARGWVEGAAWGRAA